MEPLKPQGLKPVRLDEKSGQWLILGLLALIWGTSFILMKKGLQSFSSLQVAAMRIFISFLLLVPLLYHRIKKIKKAHLLPLFVVGFIGNGIPAFLFTKAQTQVNSSVAGVLNSLTPLFALLIGLFFFKVKTTIKNLAGVIIGLSGALMLILFSGKFNFEIKNLFPFLIVLATLFYAYNVNVVKQYLHDLDGVSIVAAAFSMVGPFAGIFLLTSDYTDIHADPQTIFNFSCVFILALFSSVIATILFNNLIKHTTALFAASVTYLIPVVAIAWGLLDGESLNFLQMVAIGVILLGVYLVNSKPVKG
ncbi:MAG: EamA family transporter [Bacteroidales bacterium]